MKIQYDLFSFIFERLGRIHKNKTFFLMFRRRPDILITNLYLYSIKIQTNIDQNAINFFRKITHFFEIIF